MSEVARIPSQIDSGEPSSSSELLPLVYDELRKLAAAKLAQENLALTLQATALVHEAYLRLVGSEQQPSWDSRGHFFAAAAEAMRRILVDNARRKKREKHGGDRTRVALADTPIETCQIREDLLALDAALDKLKQVDATAAQLIQLRYFAGLTVQESADILGTSHRTTERAWNYARAWLRREMQESGGCE